MNNTAAPVLVLKNIHRAFHQAGIELHILKGIDLAIRPGEIISLVGASGAGKSTLLHTAGLLEKADDGEIELDGEGCSRLSDIDRTTS